MDKDFFVREIETHSAMLYRVAFTILRNNDACRDALQETALKAWEKRGSLRDEKLFGTWVTRILINACYDLRRKNGRIVYLDEIPEPAAPPPDPTVTMILQALPDKLRLPLMLCLMEGMSYQEAADVMRIPLTTLRSRIHRAKKVLRKELEAE